MNVLSQEKVKDIVKILLRRGVVLSSEDIEVIQSFPEEKCEQILLTLNDSAENDMDAIKKNLRLFMRLFDGIDHDTYYRMKTRAFVRHGKLAYRNLIGYIAEEAKSAGYLSSKRIQNPQETKEDSKKKGEYEERFEENNERNENDKSHISSGSAAEQNEDSDNIEEKAGNESDREKQKNRSDYEIVFNYEDFIKKREMKDFVTLFNNRLKQIGSILKTRVELSGALPARRLKEKQPREKVSFIGMISELSVTKNDNVIIKAEDRTGELTFIASASRQEIIDKTKEIFLDEVVGLKGTVGNGGVIFLEDIIWPDVPVDRPLKKARSDISAVFISDIQIGRRFLYPEFQKFIDWLNGKHEDPDVAELSKKVKYLFIVGDLVDGVGLFPGQEQEAEIKDIYEQFDAVADFLEQVPERITIFAIAGNHDPVRLAEPQPKIPKKLAKRLYEMSNMVMLTNPSIVKIAKEEDFSGIEVLLYHGMSFDYYIAENDIIRKAGGYEAPQEVMKLLLKKRHLAPTHKSSTYIPDIRKDFLVIESVPDIFASGHIHRMRADQYRSTQILMCGTWMGKTPFEEKVGHMPEPALAYHVDLKTRKTTMIDFMSQERKDELKGKGWL